MKSTASTKLISFGYALKSWNHATVTVCFAHKNISPYTKERFYMVLTWAITPHL